MKKLNIKFIVLISLIVLTSNTYSQRGRVLIQNGTLVTDKGTLLRGATDLSPYVGFDWEDIKQEIEGVKHLGLNCLHLYAESADVFHPGERVAYIDSIVRWTREDSLYLFMTATWHKNNVPDIDFIRKFWRFYAPRYKDETHMIFEICNEPDMNAPFDSLTLTMERSAYDTIRKYAPETHVLFMSYAFTINSDQAISDIKKLGDDVDWGNASISAHGYNNSSENTRNFITAIQDSGYAITIAEVPCVEQYPDRYANLAFTRVMEEEFVSYLHFLSLEQINDEPQRFKSKIESSEIRWEPDFGSWPNDLTHINYGDPYVHLHFGFYDEGSLASYYSDFRIWYISSGARIAFYNLDFKHSTDSVFVKCSSEFSNSKFELHLDSVDGQLIALCTIPQTGLYDVKTYSFPVTSIQGVHNIYFVFKSAASIFDEFVFKNPDIVSIDPIPISDNQKLLFYPNPAKSFITVIVDEITSIEIYNFQGQLLLRKQCLKNDNIIPINNISSGSYILKISNNYKVFSDILTIE